MEEFFTIDQYGLYVPRQESLQMDVAAKRLSRLLNSNTDTEFKMTERYYLTDVETTNNPYGNTNAIGAGVRMFGPQPLKGVKFKGRMSVATGSSAEGVKQLERRERKIEQYANDTLAHLAKAEPADKNSPEHALWEIEHDQALTGGGFDGNSIGDVTKTALVGMLKSQAIPDISNSTVSELFVKSCLQLRDYLVSHGLALGSLEPDGLSRVRFEQDNDGMFGFPVLRKGGAPLDLDIATRLLIDSGVDTRQLVGQVVTDRNSGKGYPYRIQDALGYILDHLVCSPSDLTSLVVFLARIQKHGWTEEGGKVKPKPGKARAVFPNSAIQACIEGMLINPYIRALQEAKVPCFPSIQDKPTRVEMIKDWMTQQADRKYGFLAADWHQYDATVPGWGLATIVQLCVKPFFKAQYANWCDAVAFILTYKYYIVDDDLARINGEEFAECNRAVPHEQVGRWHLYGLINYLISGAKFTHIGGSEYGICAVHLTIPALMGFKGVIGPQAGDDTLMAVPIESIDLSSKERTYEPLARAAEQLGMEINPSKQIFYQYGGELIGIFLQDAYCAKGDIWGVGTAYRPLAAVFYSERNKGLSVAEQMMAEIARMNQGYDSPFVHSAVEFWLEREQYLYALVKERGAEKAFQSLIETVGIDVSDIAQRIEVGSFTYGVGMDELRSGKLPILPVMDDVASKMSLNVSISKAIESLGVGTEDRTDDRDSFVSPDEEDILDD